MGRRLDRMDTERDDEVATRRLSARSAARGPDGRSERGCPTRARRRSECGHARAGIQARLDTLLARWRGIDVVGPASASMSHEIERKKVEIERIRVEAAHWWRATAELQHELETVYSTLSWRVTAPLRVAEAPARWTAHERTAAGAAAARSGVRGAVARFVRRRPRLKRWIVGPLDRFPAHARARETLFVALRASGGGGRVAARRRARWVGRRTRSTPS